MNRPSDYSRVQANSFQIIGHQMSLNYSRNTVRLFMDIFEVHLELCCQLYCGLLNAHGGYSRVDLRLVVTASRFIVFTANTKHVLLEDPCCSDISQMEILHIPCCTLGASLLGLLFWAFFIAFVAHCKTGVGWGVDGPPVVIWQRMHQTQTPLFPFSVVINTSPTETSQI